MTDRALFWVGSSLADVQDFPEEARRAAGYQLRRVQMGLMPSDWKSMPTVGPGVFEIRLQGNRAHRVFYIAKFGEAVYVLHAFEKKTQRTRQADLDLGKRRLQQLRRHRDSLEET